MKATAIKMRQKTMFQKCRDSSRMVFFLIRMPSMRKTNTSPKLILRTACIERMWESERPVRSRGNRLQCDMCGEPIPSPGERSNQAEKTMHMCQVFFFLKKKRCKQRARLSVLKLGTCGLSKGRWICERTRNLCSVCSTEHKGGVSSTRSFKLG